MLYRELMQRLAVELRLPDLAPREQGPCALRLDDLVLAFYPDEDGGFTLLCPLGDPDTPEMAEALLAGSLFADGVGGHALAMDAQGQAWLAQHFETPLPGFARFISHLQRFANAAEYWRSCLLRGTPPQFLH